jgi:glycerophosphoryl diester phosphodiesterase
MRFRWGVALAVTGLLLALVYGIAVIRAEPVTDHPLFARAPNHPLVIAHRGGMHLWPENTLYAFGEAAALGADMLEMDLRTTADGAIVVLHDPTVDRTTDGTGDVRRFTLAQLRDLDAGYRWTPDGGRTHPYRGRGLRIPTLEEVLTALPDARLNLEIKQTDPPMAEALCALLRAHRSPTRSLVASFHETAIQQFRRACPEVATSATAAEARNFAALQLLPAPPYVPPAQALQMPERLGAVPVITAPLVRAAHRSNLQVHAFTVNDTAAMRRLLELGVDGIVTDRPDLMLRLLGREPGRVPPR